jgi:hypothetical protein
MFSGRTICCDFLLLFSYEQLPSSGSSSSTKQHKPPPSVLQRTRKGGVVSLQRVIGHVLHHLVGDRMPPRVVNVGQAGGGVGNWYQELPPITRFMATACFLTSLGTYTKILDPRLLALVRPWVFQKYEVRQEAAAARANR